MALQPLLGLGRFFSFLILYTVSRTPWTGDQPVARPLPTKNNTNRINSARWGIDNDLDSYSGGTWFESRPWLRLNWLTFSWLLSVPPGKFWDSTSTKPNPPSFVIYLSSFTIRRHVTYWQTNQLTNFTEPPVAKPFNNFQTFYGTPRFINVFTRVLHWFLPWVRWIQSTPPHPITLRSIFILFTVASFLLPSSWKSYMHSSSPSCVLHVLHISSYLTSSF
jgi:hypothetical protein